MHPALLVLETTIVVYILLLVSTRVIGKKLLEQMTFFDFVTGVTIGTITGAFVVNNAKGYWVLLSPVYLTLLVIATGFLSFFSLRARKIVQGEPVVIIQNGKILEKNMRKLRYNLDDLEKQLRSAGTFDIGEVEFAVLETHGKLSVLKKSQYLPVTPADLNLSTGYKGLASEIIKDGVVLDQNLRQNHLDFAWLYRELGKAGVNDISDVVLASLQTDGTLWLDVKQDNPDYVQEVED